MKSSCIFFLIFNAFSLERIFWKAIKTNLIPNLYNSMQNLTFEKPTSNSPEENFELSILCGGKLKTNLKFLPNKKICSNFRLSGDILKINSFLQNLKIKTPVDFVDSDIQQIITYTLKQKGKQIQKIEQHLTKIEFIDLKILKDSIQVNETTKLSSQTTIAEIPSLFLQTENLKHIQVHSEDENALKFFTFTFVDYKLQVLAKFEKDFTENKNFTFTIVDKYTGLNSHPFELKIEFLIPKIRFNPFFIYSVVFIIFFTTFFGVTVKSFIDHNNESELKNESRESERVLSNSITDWKEKDFHKLGSHTFQSKSTKNESINDIEMIHHDIKVEKPENEFNFSIEENQTISNFEISNISNIIENC